MTDEQGVEHAEDIYDVAQLIVEKISWYTEAGRINAQRIIREAQAKAKKPAPAKKSAAALPDNVEETPTGKVVKARKDA